MKKTWMIACMALFLTMEACAQTPQTPAAVLAYKIAQKMKDSLQLNEKLFRQLYDINLQLHNRKMAYRQQYAGSASMAAYLQLVENTRDSLYRNLIPSDKYELYLKRKKDLVNNN